MATMSQKLEAEGGDNGNPFDDGVFDGVKKIYVGKDTFPQSISYIKIEYEKDGKTEIREHGKKNGKLKEFTVVNYPDEYITAVGGTYEEDIFHGTVLIRTLFFKTSHGITSRTFGQKKFIPSGISSIVPSGIPAAISAKLPFSLSSALPSAISSGVKFMLESKNGGKLLGFHGRAGHFLDAIGPHFFAVNYPLMHFDLEGGIGGNAWDDGAFDGVSKIFFGRNDKFVSYLRFEYAKGGRMVPHTHGKKVDYPAEFEVDYPNEHITVVEGTIDRKRDDGKLTSIKFTTSKGRTSPDIGNVTSNKFVFKKTGFKLVGFCGRSGNVIYALGAHFAPLPSPSPAPTPTPAPAPAPSPAQAPAPFVPTRSSSHNKIEAVGGKGGETFDDGAIDNVRKVYVGMVDSNIGYLKFEYEKDGKREIREHGKKSGSGTEVFEVHKDDYITSVRVYYERLAGVIKSLTFKTFNGKTSPTFEKTISDIEKTKWNMFFLEGGKITGFHGNSGDVLHSLGAYVSRSPTRMLRGKWIQPWPRSVFALAVVGKYIIISGGEIEMDPEAHVGPGKLDNGAFVLDTESLLWEKLEEGHSPRGWSASTTASLDGKQGLLMFGGKAPTNGRYDDIFFYGVDSA
ncbi:unnamed protein product [Eruca vesicaria subsp. sativa]|uniref:Jacalin-type lectin domain-containing protein n=1 Tax=Eruca vesicaria subsp. sativa TaxID=29727 RepID=A0ABC8J8R4_ERUVS|nr:unnamed protein product [Eruca vesicaria subsp. sativa]